MRLLTTLSFSWLLLLRGLVVAEQTTGNHPEWDRWCGKVYQPQHPSFEPGGQTVEPARLPDGPALDVQFKPRYSIYLSDEKQAEFVVKAGASPWRGAKWPNLDGSSSSTPPPPLVFNISLASDERVVLVAEHRVEIGAADALVRFDLAKLTPRLEPYQVVLAGADTDGRARVSAASEIVYLPDKRTGSVARLDNLAGGILFRSAATGHRFEPFLPIGYYASCDDFLCHKDYAAKIKEYQALGMNSMVSLTTVQDSRPAYELMDGLGLRYMYNLRDSYKNLTDVREQVSVIRDFDGLYSYWGADEPDGHQDPFDLLPKAREAIRQLDPYHPVSVTLNCQNFYFEEYTAGADIIMEDVYPIGINSTFSKWGTPCNATYGDCGCDDCAGGVGDVPARLDALARYETWLGLWPKTKAHNPQAFNGEGYWARNPTDEEEVAMIALALHHGAKLMAAWVWPYVDSLGHATGKFGTAVSTEPARGLVVGGRAIRLDVASHRGGVVDAAYWAGEGRMLISVVNEGYDAIERDVSFSLPKGVIAGSIEAVVWGNATWTLGGKSGVVKLRGLGGMATNMIIVRVK